MSAIDRLFWGMRAAATGMSAERVRMDVIADNIANVNTTKTPEGGPFRRRHVLFEPLLAEVEGQLRPAGVRVTGVERDMTKPHERIHQPTHPDADANGMVTLPNINALEEMADLVTAVRSYEANMSVQASFVQMAERALRSAQ